MAFESRHHIANDIHFTLPEGLWQERSDFFRSFGFLAAEKSKRQYRNGEEGAILLSVCVDSMGKWKSAASTAVDEVFHCGYSSARRLLLSMRPEFAERIFEGKKQVEIRRKFSKKWIGSKAVIYGSKPLAALMGEVTVADVTLDSPQKIWDRFGRRAGCSHEEFAKYVGSAPNVYAIELGELAPYTYSISTTEIARLINVEDLRPPQSFLDVKANSDSPWLMAISVASLLHAKSRPRQHVS